MANRKLCTLILSLLMVIATLQIYAQEKEEEETSTYYIEQTESGVVFHQKLAWKKEKYALRYVISIQHKVTTAADTQKIHDFVSSLTADDRTLTTGEDSEATDSGWEQVLNYATTDTSIEVSLPSGSYRYRIHVYNLLEKLAGNSGWIPLEIYKALQPEITTISPEIVYLEDDIPTTFTLTGASLLSETTFSFMNQKNKELLLTNPVFAEDNTSVTFTINPDVIDTGTYTFGALNPGGLSTNSSFIVRFQKTIDTEVEAGYRTSFVLYDGTFQNYFGSSLYATTFDAKCTFIPLKRKLGYFGFSFHPQLYFISRKTSGFSLSTRMWTASLDLVYQYPLIKHHLILDVHAGPMMLFIENLTFTYPSGITTSPFNSWYMGFDGGAGVQWYPFNSKQLKPFFIEASIEYEKAFIPNMSLNMISPGLRIGYQF